MTRTTSWITQMIGTYSGSSQMPMLSSTIGGIMMLGKAMEASQSMLGKVPTHYSSCLLGRSFCKDTQPWWFSNENNMVTMMTSVSACPRIWPAQEVLQDSIKDWQLQQIPRRFDDACLMQRCEALDMTQKIIFDFLQGSRATWAVQGRSQSGSVKAQAESGWAQESRQ